MNLAERERVKYERVWAECPLYQTHSPGLRHAPEAFAWFTQTSCSTLLDLGCGDGRALDWFREQPVVAEARGVDIAHASPTILRHTLWEPIPEEWRADFGYSCDVLEHIPTEKVRDVIACMAGAVRKAAWVQIALFEDSAGSMGDWGTLHLTIESYVWWKHALDRSFNVVYGSERRQRASFLLLTK